MYGERFRVVKGTREGDPLEPLAREAARGHRGALEILLLELQPAMFRSVGSVMGASHPHVEDVVQESLLRLARALPSFRGECATRSFAVNIGARTAIDWLRSEDAHTRALERAASEPPPLAPASSDDPERGTILRDSTTRLLSILTPIQAEALVLRAVFGLSWEELGRTLSIPPETARSRVKLARRAFDAARELDPRLDLAIHPGVGT